MQYSTYQSIVANSNPTIEALSAIGNLSKYGTVANTWPNGDGRCGNLSLLDASFSAFLSASPTKGNPPKMFSTVASAKTGAVASSPSGE